MHAVTLTLEGLTFAHGDATPLFSDVTLSLGPGFTGLVGENGSGKTSLLRLLAGELSPTAGRVGTRPREALIALCPQSVEHVDPAIDMLSGRRDGEALRLFGVLALSPGDLCRWDTLSPGERKRWQVAAALAARPDVLLLDEPTNHADAAMRAALLAALRDFTGLGVLVSHDRALLNALCVDTLRLAGGSARLYSGPYDTARAAWEAEMRSAERRRDAAQQTARDAARKLADACRARTAAEQAMSGRRRDPKDRDARSAGAKTLRGWAENRLGGEVARLRTAADKAREGVEAIDTPTRLGRSVFAEYTPAPRPVILSLDAAELRAGERVLATEVSIALRRGEHVRLAGPNGAGKSTLLRALLNAGAADARHLFHLPQETRTDEAAAVVQAIRSLDPAARGRALSLVAALGADPAQVMASTRPSPGEVRKLQLALGLGRHVWALVLDEPTNHLDLQTVERLEPALAAFPGALLLVSHDDTFAAACTASTWRLDAGRLRHA
jgi:ATPase subunit of ABC transporter with duplicated ATPase domains